MLLGFGSRPQAIALFIHLEQRWLKGRLEADFGRWGSQREIKG
ncbi:hypothetical protein [Nostoc mirabile]|nr:hypothetical protein [Nostoc mirabile]